MSLPPHWRVIDPKSATFEADYRSLLAENPDFGTAFPQDALKQITTADGIAFDFTPGRSSPSVFTTMIVSSETLASEEQSRYTRIYLDELRGATNVTTNDMRVGNANGKRVTADYPVHRDAADILRGAAPTPGGEWLRQTAYTAYPEFGGATALTFISRLELADAYASEFQAIADRFLAHKGPRDVLLTLNDVPAGFRVTVDAATTIADLAKAANSDPTLIQQKVAGLGWIGGWHRTFQKDGPSAEQITDSSSVYGSTDGAKQALAENTADDERAQPGSSDPAWRHADR